MAFIQVPQVPGLQALNQIRQARLQQGQQDNLEAEEEIRRQQIAGREALAGQFGQGALDPNALAQIRQAQAQQDFADANQRQVDLAEDAASAERRAGAVANLVAAGRQVLNRTGDPSQVAALARRAGPALGATEEDLAAFEQALGQDPAGALDSLGALFAQQGQGQQLPAETRNFQVLTQLANDPNVDEQTRRAAQIQLGLRSRAGQSRILPVNGVQTLVEIGPGGQLVTEDGSPVVQNEQGELVTQAQAPQQSSRVTQQPLSTQGQENTAARRRAEAEETGQRTATLAFDRLQEGLEEATQARESLNAIQQAQNQLDEGIVTGTLANAQVAGLRALETLTGVTQEEVGNTEAFLAATGPLVATRIQAFGAGTGLSDADREFAAQIAGRDITLTEGGIRRILALNAATEAARIERFNEQRDRFVRRNPDTAELFPRREISDFGQRALDRVQARRRAEEAGNPLPPLFNDPDSAVTFEANDDETERLNRFLGQGGN